MDDGGDRPIHVVVFLTLSPILINRANVGYVGNIDRYHARGGIRALPECRVSRTYVSCPCEGITLVEFAGGGDRNRINTVSQTH